MENMGCFWGAFYGNKTIESFPSYGFGPPLPPVCVASQEVNPQELAWMDGFGGNGQSMLHEVDEAYIAAQVAFETNEKYTPPAIPNSKGEYPPQYEYAHRKAFKQPLVLYDKLRPQYEKEKAIYKSFWMNTELQKK